MNKTKITAAEMVSIVSGKKISGEEWADTYRKVARLLQDSKKFNYAHLAGLKENLLRYAQLYGFDAQLKKAAFQYATYISEVHPSKNMDTRNMAQKMAERAGVPSEINFS